MTVQVDTAAIRSLMKNQGLDMSALARRAGLSRQALYRFLKPDFTPLGDGFLAMTAALGVSPLCLLRDDEPRARDSQRIASLLQDAAHDDARAFEVLPANLLSALETGLHLPPLVPPAYQLLAAAAEVARHLSGDQRLDPLIALHRAEVEPNLAFFFGARAMSAERIIAMTPEPMQRHLVFGAFALDDFRRHLP